MVAAGFWDEQWRNLVAFFFKFRHEEPISAKLCGIFMVGWLGAWADLPIKLALSYVDPPTKTHLFVGESFEECLPYCLEKVNKSMKVRI